MAEKNDDIKQLFAHLGLNPGDYKELRNPPKTTAAREETQESRRNWSLLRSVRVGGADRPTGAPVMTVSATPATPVPRIVAHPPPSLATTESIERDVRELSRAELERESLQSFFDAVKEPVPPATLEVPQDAPSIPQTTERHATEHLLDELRRVPETAAARVADLVRSRWPQDRAVGGRPDGSVEPAPPAVAPTVVSVPASVPQASPMPPAASARPVPPASPAASGLLKLRFGTPAEAAPAAAADGETLADVFRRLAGPGRPR